MARIRGRLKDEFGEAAYRSWLKQMTLAEVAGGPLGAREQAAEDVDVVVGGSAAAADAEREPEAPAGIVTADGATEKPSDLSASLDPRFTFEDFVTGNPSELAYAASAAKGDGASIRSSSMAASASARRTSCTRSPGTFAPLGAEEEGDLPLRRKIQFQFVRALRFKDTMAFKEQFRWIDVLMVDDVQFIAG